jgi:dinuclear metal center YbgI/SA1388 family protein
MKMAALMDVAEKLAPRRDAESWDNVGLLVGDPQQDVTRVLLTVDHTPEVQREAEALKCEAIVAYHPPIFSAVKRITAGTVYFDALRAGMAVYCFHTALDVAPGGTNDVLADLLQLSHRAPVKLPAQPSPDGRGMGRVGDVTPCSVEDLVARLKQQLGVDHVLVCGPAVRTVKRVAVLAGSCGEFLDDVVATGADVLVTGELRHHDALKAASRGLTCVCTLHSHSERPVLPSLAARFREEIPSVEFLISKADRDPLRFA